MELINKFFSLLFFSFYLCFFSSTVIKSIVSSKKWLNGIISNINHYIILTGLLVLTEMVNQFEGRLVIQIIQINQKEENINVIIL